VKKAENKRFFGKVLLRNNGAFWHAGLPGGTSVSLWISHPLAEPKPGWSAKLVHQRGAVVMAIVVRGRTAPEALRRLERRSVDQVRSLVAVFAKLSNSAVLDVRKNIHKSRKK
jgi:hypothetical protein